MCFKQGRLVSKNYFQTINPVSVWETKANAGFQWIISKLNNHYKNCESWHNSQYSIEQRFSWPITVYLLPPGLMGVPAITHCALSICNINTIFMNIIQLFTTQTIIGTHSNSSGAASHSLTTLSSLFFATDCKINVVLMIF